MKFTARSPDTARGDGEPASANATPLSYALITPARNEAALIENTLQSIIAQTVRPRRWIIVSDGSTDETDEIVQRYASAHTWIELLRLPPRTGRHFAAKASAFNEGYARLSRCEFDVVGNLDADITVEPDYIEYLLEKFSQDPHLGVAGTPFVEDHDNRAKHTYAHQFAHLEHVSGACQLFRRSCFADIGGYKLVEGGAIDWIAVTTARMNGWKTQTFTEKVSFHHRKIGTATTGPLRARFHYGKKAYYVGGHPLWVLLRGMFVMREKPYVLAGLAFELGYLWAVLCRVPRAVDDKLIRFHRAEQMSRLRKLATRGRPKAADQVARQSF